MFKNLIRSVSFVALAGASMLAFSGSASASQTINYGSFSGTVNLTGFATDELKFVTSAPSSSLTFSYNLTSCVSCGVLASFNGTATDGSGNSISSGSLLSAGTVYNFLLGATSTITFLTLGGQAIGSFSGTFSAVPEPAEWLMMLLGVGAVGFMVRRKLADAAQEAIPA